MTHNEAIRRIEAIRASTSKEQEQYQRSAKRSAQASINAAERARDVAALDFVLELLMSSRPAPERTRQ